MTRYFLTILFFLSFLTGSVAFCIAPGNASANDQDTVKDVQTLYNGIIWTNLYYRVKEDQFLFSKDLLPGSVSISGKTFKNLQVRYDIYNDEIMIPTNRGLILQLNKEMVDSFSLNFNGKKYNFVNLRNDSTKSLNGYANLLYKGKTALYVKYKKEIELLAVDKKYDLFYQTLRIYFFKDDIFYPITSIRDIYKVIGDDEDELKAYVKKNKLYLTKKEPQTFILPVVYYDTMNK